MDPMALVRWRLSNLGLGEPLLPSVSVLIEAPFVPPDRVATRALHETAGRHGHFLGVTATVAADR
jgi:hypothetical protein